MRSFRAFRIHQQDGKVVPQLEDISLDDLSAGEVVIEVEYSTINFKDALAATGAGKILRRYPLVGGIDLAGKVVSSSCADFAAGQRVLVNGCGLSEAHDGGYAQFARVKPEWVIPIPQQFGTFEAMAIGTAGFTAALAVHHMEINGQHPDRGEILVSGASGGVGSIAIDILAARGYRAVALTGKDHATDYLHSLGAARVIKREAVRGSRPLEAAQWGGAIDNVGGETLAWLTRTVDAWGNIASVGMASSVELKTTVLPFILRGVNLLGINSVSVPRTQRLAVWKRLATDLRPRHLDKIVTRTIRLEQLPAAFDDYLRNHIIGRTVVKVA